MPSTGLSLAVGDRFTPVGRPPNRSPIGMSNHKSRAGAKRCSVTPSVASGLVLFFLLTAYAQAQSAAEPATLPAIASSRLPRDLSPWSMFLTADIVVQAVIVGLVFASMVTWTVWFAKSIELYRAHRRLTRGLTAISAYRSLSEVFTRLGDNSDLF